MDRSIYDQLLTRMRNPFVKNKLMVVCSNPDSGWIKSVIYDNEKRKDPKHPEHEDYNPAISCFVWETALNKYLPPDYIDNNAKGKPEWWIKKFLKGSMSHQEGQVYPNFASCIIDDFEIPAKWEKFVTLDHGLMLAHVKSL